MEDSWFLPDLTPLLNINMFTLLLPIFFLHILHFNIYFMNIYLYSSHIIV